MKTNNNKEQVRFSKYADFKAEHREAERHNRGQYNKAEIKGMLRNFKSQGMSFETVCSVIAEYGRISGTTIPSEDQLTYWWAQIR